MWERRSLLYSKKELQQASGFALPCFFPKVSEHSEVGASNARSMGKKGSWFSAIKRAFVPSTKDKLVNGSEKPSVKEKKKKGLGKLKHGDSFIPLFREPSSIEKILGEAERDHSHLIDFRPLRTSEPPKTPSFPSPRAPTPLQDAASDSTPTPPNHDSPPQISSFRRADFSPRNASPQRVTTPPKITTPQRVSTPPKNATLQRVTTPPKGFTSQLSVSPRRSVTPPESSIPQRASSSPVGAGVGASSHASTSSNVVTPPKSTSSKFVHRPRLEPTLRNQHICAARIQSAYRGYVARRSYRALRGLVRLQGVVKGQSVKRQTTSTMKSMQLLVRVQTQIQSRRIQMLENQAIQRQAQYKNESQASDNTDNWDDSTLTKDEVEARRQRKFEAIAKRERALAYAYSHQSSKTTPKTAQAAMLDIRASGGYPWWWNWLDRQMNPYTQPTNPPQTQPINNLHMTPPRPGRTSPLIPHSSQSNLGFDNSEAATPKSTRSLAVPSRMKLSPTPSRTPGSKFPWPKTSAANRSPFGSHFKDDDSLTSCPQFSVPRYMEPTASAKAKVRGEFGISPIDDKSKRRMSYPLSQGLGSFKWSKRGSLFSANTTPNRETGSQRALEKQSAQSVGNRSVDSSVSMPAAVGRKPFNRFV